MSTALFSAVIPTYRAIALHFQPLASGTGTRLLTNPALVGQPGPGVCFGQALHLTGRYYVTGPAFPYEDLHLLARVVQTGSLGLEQYNRDRDQSRRIYSSTTHAEALTILWNLVTDHYQVGDAFEQVREHELREATRRNGEREQRQAEAEQQDATKSEG